jgi:hypothetical protein
MMAFLARLGRGVLASSPWLLTGLVGLWQWGRMSSSGNDLRYVVLIVVILCALFVAITLWRSVPDHVADFQETEMGGDFEHTKHENE